MLEIVLGAMGDKRSKYRTGLGPQVVCKFMALVTRISFRKMSLLFYQHASALCYLARWLFYLHRMNLARDVCRCMSRVVFHFSLFFTFNYLFVYLFVFKIRVQLKGLRAFASDPQGT